MIGDHRGPTAQPGDDRSEPTGRAAEVMGVHHVGFAEGGDQLRRHRVGGVPTAMPPGGQHAHVEAAAVAPHTRMRSERDELAVHAGYPGRGPGQLERVAFAAAEEAVTTEWGWCYMEDPDARRVAGDSRITRPAHRRLPVPPADGRGCA